MASVRAAEKMPIYCVSKDEGRLRARSRRTHRMSNGVQTQDRCEWPIDVLLQTASSSALRCPCCSFTADIRGSYAQQDGLHDRTQEGDDERERDVDEEEGHSATGADDCAACEHRMVVIGTCCNAMQKKRLRLTMQPEPHRCYRSGSNVRSRVDGSQALDDRRQWPLPSCTNGVRCVGHPRSLAIVSLRSPPGHRCS
jgi:hypothetical protein